jgi:hypothetical protein
MTTPIHAVAMPPKSDAPDIETIVATVRQPAGLRLALQTWREVQQQYSDLATELRQAAGALQSAGGKAAANAGPLTKEIIELEQRLRGLADNVQTALGAVRAARPPYTAAVAVALAPYRRQCAQRALIAATALTEELRQLERIDDELAAVGAAAGVRLPRQGLRPTLARLQKLAE